MLNLIKKYEEIFIIGHDNADVDSILSCIFLNNFFKSQGIKSDYGFFSIDKTSFEWCKQHINNISLEEKLIKQDISNKNIFLVDHNDNLHSLNVIGCIDHHPTQKNVNYLYYKNINAASCCEIIYKIMLKYNFIFTEEQYKLVLYSIMVDTDGLRNTKYTNKDKIIVDFIRNKINVNFYEMIKDSSFITNLNQNISVVCNNGLKKYCYNNNNIISSYIHIDSDRNLYKYLKFIKQEIINKDIAMWVFIVVNYKYNTTTVYKIINKKNKQYILSKKYNKILSRGKNIMPKIESYFNKNK